MVIALKRASGGFCLPTFDRDCNPGRRKIGRPLKQVFLNSPERAAAPQNGKRSEYESLKTLIPLCRLGLLIFGKKPELPC